MSNILPNSLIRKLGANPLFDEQAFIDIHEKGERQSSIRINEKKITAAPFAHAEPIPWCDRGFYLEERPSFTLDPLYHAGCYYSQDASSMFISHIIQHLKLDGEPLKALDLCAAPGGKTTLLNSYLHPQSLLVANEIIKTRVPILMENMVRWGNSNVVITNNDPSAFKRLPGYFDLLLIDAPCSGSGMFRKDSGAIDEWSEANVKLCSERQQRILAEAMDCLKTDGILLYSTCSYSQEENEDIADWLVKEYGLKSIQIPVGEEWGIEETQSDISACFGYRFYPHKVKGEGFFITAFVKTEFQETFNRKKIKPEKSDVPNGIIEHWLNNASTHTAFLHHENVHIFPKDYETDLKILQNVLYLKNAGTNIGKLAGKELIPAHGLALSTAIKANIPTLELTLEEAQNYLRKENIDPEHSLKNGWTLVTYKNVKLGWIKILANRINNYYPKESRIAYL
ncbi:NOL1/NOP2/sun family protein [Sphingobacterium spiritivorum ATCC 33300]|uniref:NOL1/NOP2/sun family protein n=1 Tax=Sphingobacterium spiritivorum ATCC 33300 TaxID=525372 RepID=C2FSG7_SPHSI|nr:RNA methyltransferase [Sphingobacterium spiritivorum]EEI94157.1 NOL1/NOP2/sun family protein [Sphingobacterium spiritivorum ATCC 33300]QQS97903.1 RNA methyltransferase [Sphingobacterium spiritivorum]